MSAPACRSTGAGVCSARTRARSCPGALAAARAPLPLSAALPLHHPSQRPPRAACLRARGVREGVRGRRRLRSGGAVAHGRCCSRGNGRRSRGRRRVGRRRRRRHPVGRCPWSGRSGCAAALKVRCAQLAAAMRATGGMLRGPLFRPAHAAPISAPPAARTSRHYGRKAPVRRCDSHRTGCPRAATASRSNIVSKRCIRAARC